MDACLVLYAANICKLQLCHGMGRTEITTHLCNRRKIMHKYGSNSWYFDKYSSVSAAVVVEGKESTQSQWLQNLLQFYYFFHYH